MNATYSPTTGKEGWKGWQKALLGVGIGCGVLVLGSIGACITGAWYLSTTADQLPSNAAIGSGTILVAGTHDRHDDEGVVEMVEFLVGEFQSRANRMDADRRPEFLDWIEKSPVLQAQRKGQMRQMVPRDVAFTVQPAANGEDLDWLLAANLPNLPRVIPMMFRFMARHEEAGSAFREYRGHTIIDDGKGVAFCAAGGTILGGSRRSIIEGFIDRADETEVDPVTLSRVSSDLGERWDAYGVLTEEGSLLAEFAPDAAQATMVSETFGGLTVGIDIAGADELQGELRVVDTDAATRDAWAAVLDAEFDAKAEAWANKGAALGHTTTTAGDEVVVEFNVTGLRDAIPAWLDDLEATDRF